MTPLLFIFVFLLFALPGSAEDARDWEAYLQAIYENSDEAAVSMEEAYQHLLSLTQQPLDVNTTTTEELLRIPGITQQQTNDIVSFRQRYGRLRSLTELSVIPSIPAPLYSFLSHFLTVGQPSTEPWYSKSELSKNAHFIGNSVTVTASVPTYRRKGDDDGTYLGDPVAHSLRYTLSMGSNAVLNLSAGKTAGEPFASHGNTLYDTYSYNLSLRHLGIFRTIILGTYRGQFGMGLTFNNGFSLSKQAMLASVGRRLSNFSPYSGVSDMPCLRGAAVTADLSSRLRLSAFLSYNDADATLNGDSLTVATILTSPYHRTAADMRKKHNVSLFAVGGHLSYDGTLLADGLQWSLGASFVRTAFSRSLDPIYGSDGTIPASKLYRLYQPTGSTTWNAALDYRLAYDVVSVTGEVATCDAVPAASGTRPLATLNTLTVELTRSLTLSAVHRYYSYRYHAYLGKAFGENGSVTNESGTFLTLQWRPTGSLTLQTYSDYATFPWYRYHALPDTHSWDHSLAVLYSPNDRWTLSARYRYKDKDNARQALRLLSTYNGNRLQLRTQCEACLQRSDTTSCGYILSQSASYDVARRYTLYINAAYFHTDDYASRLYSYERGMQYQFSNAAYYGKGIHASLLATARLSRHLKTNLKLSHTHYYNRETLGTADRTIFSNHQTDIELQLILKP